MMMSGIGTAYGATPPNDGSDEVFNPDVIAEVWLEIPDLSWSPIDDVALAGCGPHPRSYHPGSIKIEATEFPGSGIRAKAVVAHLVSWMKKLLSR